jgi:PIN domain nuclease of toxin-antitoxin system
LLDTHIFLWLTMGSPRLKAKARKTISSADKIYISSASIWEIAIKISLGKLTADIDDVIEAIAANGFEELPVFSRHARRVAAMPRLHGDPFDRLLVAQAVEENMQLLTADAYMAAYSDLVVMA